MFGYLLFLLILEITTYNYNKFLFLIMLVKPSVLKIKE